MAVRPILLNLDIPVPPPPPSPPTPARPVLSRPRAQSVKSAKRLRASPSIPSLREPRPLTSASRAPPSRSRSRASSKRRAGTTTQKRSHLTAYQSLPPSIQRKFFSDYEKLQIASKSPQLHIDSSRFIRTDAYPSRHPSSVHGSGHSRRQRLKKQQSIRDEHAIAHAEAVWFLHLPDKARRQLFEREEQLVLAAAVDLETFDSRSNPTVRRILGHTARRHSFSGESLLNNTLCEDTHSEEIPEDTEDMNCFDGEPPAFERPRRPSLSFRRRNFSMSRPSTQSVFHRQSSSSSNPVSPLYPQQRNRSLSVGTHLARASHDSASQAFDTAALHYQDPEARSKLRNYLASPQKFDEAIEFGFPSSPPPAPESNEFKHRSTSANDAQTFLKDDVISFIDRYDEDSEDEDDDLSSNEGTSSPVTPGTAGDMDSGFRYASSGTRSLFSSLDSNNLPPLNLVSFKFRQPNDPDFPITNREMTLRMTLTRPDLRAPEEELYGWQSPTGPDPLALEELPAPVDDVTGEHGAFAIKSQRNSGVLKRILSYVKSNKKS